jgi:zinc transporter 7
MHPNLSSNSFFFLRILSRLHTYDSLTVGGEHSHSHDDHADHDHDASSGHGHSHSLADLSTGLSILG